MEAQEKTPSGGESEEYTLTGEHWINGVRHLCLATPDVMARYPDFPVHEQDVYICGFPKTGNTWTSTIVGAILQQDDLESWVIDRPIKVGSIIELTFDSAVDLPRPTFFFTHLPYHLLPTGVREKNAKIVHISRDPKDVAVSFYYYHKNISTFGPWNGPWDVFYDNFISGQVAFGSYFSFLRTYWEQKNNPNLMNITYENLKRDPKTWIGKLAEFLSKPLDQEKLEKIVKLTSFNNMKATPSLNLDDLLASANHPALKLIAGGSFLRKGVVGDWRHLFTEEQRRQTDGLYRQLCKDTGMDVFSDEGNSQ